MCFFFVFFAKSANTIIEMGRLNYYTEAVSGVIQMTLENYRNFFLCPEKSVLKYVGLV